jgi:selenocysteine lyase/cysteine desulfurase
MYESPYKNLVVGANTEVPLSNGTYVPYINFDNAATTPPFTSVLREIINFSPWYSSINRGKGYKSQVTSEFYENSRDVILNFVKGNKDHDTVIYVKNTTEGINKLAYRLCSNNKKCVILSTNMEHHSNDLPWRGKYTVEYIELDSRGRLSLDDLEKKLKKHAGSVRLVTVSGASNVTGFINPIHDIAIIAHKYNAKILVDGAQLVPHVPVDMKSPNSIDHIDYLVFSGHKMYAPFGIGVLIGPKETFEKGDPDYTGGGTVQLVTHEYVIWNEPPSKEEAGTPNFMGVVAIVAAVKTLNSLPMENVDKYEKSLADYTVAKLRQISDIEIYGDYENYNNRVGIIPFNIKGLHHNLVAEALSYEAGIAVRTGCFCAHPYVQKLLSIPDEDVEDFMRYSKEERPGMIRASFGLYNSFSEADYFIGMIDRIVKHKDYYYRKYNKK